MSHLKMEVIKLEGKEMKKEIKEQMEKRDIRKKTAIKKFLMS